MNESSQGNVNLRNELVENFENKKIKCFEKERDEGE